jgi:four helix bundle protein
MRDQEDRPSRYAARSERGRGTPQYERGSRGGDWKGRRDDGGGGRGEGRAARDGEQDSGRSAGHSSANRPRLEDMDVFRLAHDLAQRIHEITGRFPAEERAGLAAQLQRSAALVPAQLAIGSSRWDRDEYRAGVTAARDVAAEAQYYLLLAKDLGHLSAGDCADMREGYERVSRMLTRLAQALG